MWASQDTDSREQVLLLKESDAMLMDSLKLKLQGSPHVDFKIGFFAAYSDSCNVSILIQQDVSGGHGHHPFQIMLEALLSSEIFLLYYIWK